MRANRSATTGGSSIPMSLDNNSAVKSLCVATRPVALADFELWTGGSVALDNSKRLLVPGPLIFPFLAVWTAVLPLRFGLVSALSVLLSVILENSKRLLVPFPSLLRFFLRARLAVGGGMPFP